MIARRISHSCAILSIPGICLIPSTADRILIAGVMTHSPIISEMPSMARRVNIDAERGCLMSGSRIPFRTRVPPSPVCESFMARMVYCTVTITVSVQKISEIVPMILARVGSMKR